MRIKLSELKRIIRSEVKRSRRLKEQGRPISVPLGRPYETETVPVGGRGRPTEKGGQAYGEQEFLDYVRAGLKSGRGRPEEFVVSIGDTDYSVSGSELLDAFDPDGTPTDIASPDGEFLATVPLDLDVIEIE